MENNVTDDRHTHPRVNWMKKPGEPVQWFELVGTVEYVDFDGTTQSYRKWLPITPERAWDIATEADRSRA